MQAELQAPVSVVIPCLNCEDTIYRATRSVFQQTWQPKEVILIADDGSTDHTLSRLHEIRTSLGLSGIKVLNLSENKGPGAARNAGWNVATQPHIAFLDADDAWHPRKIEIQLKYMQNHPEIAITGHRSMWLREGEGECLPSIQNSYRMKPITKPITKKIMLVSNCFATSTVMLKRDLAFRFEPAKRHSEDYLLWLRIICNKYLAGYIDLCMAYSFKAPYGSKGLSSQLLAMERGELDTFKRLYKDQMISLPTLVALGSFSVAKFARRMAISKLRMIRSGE